MVEYCVEIHYNGKMVKQPQFRTPYQMKVSETTPVSCRVPIDIKIYLEKEANKEGLSLGAVVAGALKDYVSWLKENKKRK